MCIRTHIIRHNLLIPTQFKMLGREAHSTLIVCLLVIMYHQVSASVFWRPRPTLPSNPTDQFYNAFQKIPPKKETAKKLEQNFLHIYPKGSKGKRSVYLEDVVVVFDGSGSVGSCEFNKGKKAMEMVMGLADKNPDYDTKYAWVTFSDTANINFKFSLPTVAKTYIKGISYPSGGTNTAAGLTLAQNLFNDPKSGRRPYQRNSREVIFLVTDGKSNVNKHLTVPKAEELKRLKIEIFVVGVGTYIDGIDEMVKVASTPYANHLFRVKDLDGFYDIIKLILKDVSPGKYKLLNYKPPC